MQSKRDMEQDVAPKATTFSRSSRRKCLFRRFALREKLRLGERLGIDVGLSRTREERIEHLKAIAELIGNEKNWELHGWLHENLCILDEKANAILAVNSITLATLTIFYATLSKSALSIVKIGFVIAFLLLVWSIIPLARIAFVYWSVTEDFLNSEEMLNDLLRVRDERSKIVRASILKGAVAFCIFAFILIVDVLAGLL